MQVIAFAIASIALFNLINPWLATLIVSLVVLALATMAEFLTIENVEENNDAG
jgi:Na+/glutamate symporter